MPWIPGIPEDAPHRCDVHQLFACLCQVKNIVLLIFRLVRLNKDTELLFGNEYNLFPTKIHH